MTRLIDADALLEEVNKLGVSHMIISYVKGKITNAPTVQREEQDKLAGWVSVPMELIDRFPEINMGNYSDDSVYELNNWGIEVVQSIQATPTD